LGTNDKLQIRIFKEKEEEIHIKHTSKWIKKYWLQKNSSISRWQCTVGWNKISLPAWNSSINERCIRSPTEGIGMHKAPRLNKPAFCLIKPIIFIKKNNQTRSTKNERNVAATSTKTTGSWH
jgi:hypothetical protein